MKQTALSGFRIFSILTLFIIMQVVMKNCAFAQIYEPEGLNMPGAWNAWTNPPANNLALANPNQVPGGRLVKVPCAQLHWQTRFSVNTTGADLIGGTYNWLFTSGPVTNYYQNKWAGVSVVVNTLQNYTKEGVTDNTATLVDGKWYTVNWEDLGYQDSRAIFMETSAEPVAITSVSVPSNVFENIPVVIDITTATPPSSEEHLYLNYTTDNWVTSQGIAVTMNGTNGTATIPGLPTSTGVYYYVLSSTLSGLTDDFGLCALQLNNNEGINYYYSIGTPPPPTITFANLQWPGSGEIETGNPFDVYGQVFITGITGQATPAPGLDAWVGYSTTDSDPATWTNWVVATHNGPVGSNDEFRADIGSVITATGTYYYATRFKYNDDPYKYGGFNGGFWDGTTNVSGVLTVYDVLPDPDFDWINLQYPGSAIIIPGENLDVYAQAYIEGVTGQPDPAPGVESWIGYSSTNTDPSEWTNWIQATFSGPSGNNDEYVANLGQYLIDEGTYYYASRFRLNSGEFFYGGFSETGGGPWDGIANVSGMLTVQSIINPFINWANLQYPDSGMIVIGQPYDVYAQVWIEGITGQPEPTPGLESWIGYSLTDTNPDTWSDWVPASFNEPSGNNDEFVANIGTEFTQTGNWYYASRFRYNDGDFVYGGFSETGGGFWDGTENVSGFMEVSEPQQTFPVLFTIIDATELHDAIKLKGGMTAWDTIAMNPDNHTWTLTLDMVPGTYEWGAIEDDGTQNGLWLIEGGNLVMTLGDDGTISGIVTYTTLVTNSTNLPAGSKIYPNPVKEALNLYVPGLTGFRVVDMKGRLVYRKMTTNATCLIDLSGYQSGVYQLDIMIGDRIWHQKIVRY